MSMRKFFTSVSLLVFISNPALSMDFRVIDVESNSNVYKVGWDQQSLEAQTQGAVFMRAKIKKLEQENEQLRNSFSQMRNNDERAQSNEYDARLQALIEENKRLSNKLQNSKLDNNAHKNGVSADAFAKKVYDLKLENSKIRKKLDEAIANGGSGNLLLKQENKRLKSSVTALYAADEVEQREITYLQNEISALKSKNKNLTSISGKYSKENIGKVVSLQKTVQELQAENRNLAQTLASSSNKLLGLHERAELTENESNQSVRSITILKNQLSKSQQENIQLNKQIKDLSLTKTPYLASNNNDVKLLKKQNQSLRDTIRAQNNVLISADNAKKTAERLLLENARLKKQVDIAGKVGLSNGKSAKDLFVRNAKLENDLGKQRDDYTSKLEGLKATLKQLRAENDRYVMGKVTSAPNEKRFSKMMAELQEKDGLLKEVNNALVLKTREAEGYKDEILAIKGRQSKKIAGKISDYKVNISNMNAKSDEQESVLTALKVENQDLRAQIKLFSENVAVEARKSFSASHKENQTKNVSQVTYVETSYPSVDDVSPLLEHDGAHRFDKEDFSNDESNSLFLSETLLSQELKPLPN